MALDACERGDAWRLAHGNSSLEAENRGQQRDVLPTRELDVEAGSDLQQGQDGSPTSTRPAFGMAIPEMTCVRVDFP